MKLQVKQQDLMNATNVMFGGELLLDDSTSHPPTIIC